jgi:hypothetical protein
MLFNIFGPLPVNAQHLLWKMFMRYLVLLNMTANQAVLLFIANHIFFILWPMVANQYMSLICFITISSILTPFLFFKLCFIIFTENYTKRHALDTPWLICWEISKIYLIKVSGYPKWPSVLKQIFFLIIWKNVIRSFSVIQKKAKKILLLQS